jgi:hypothetical protein
MELYCDFAVFTPIFNDNMPIYKCMVTDVKSLACYGRVIGIKGIHVEGKTNKDVHTLTMYDQQLEHFPRYLCSVFPNLRSVSIVGCGIKSISRLDFIGFEDVEKLMLNGNKIKTLAADVFEFAKNLEGVSFFANEIEFIDECTFEELKKLKYLNLKLNKSIDLCVNEFTHVRMSMSQLKGFIKIKFGGRQIEDNAKMNRKLSETLAFLENFIESSKTLVEDNFSGNRN